MTTGKTIALTIRTFVSRIMSLLFNTLSRFVMAFLARSNRLLISWLQLPSAVILESKKRKSVIFHFSPFYLPRSNGAWYHDLRFFLFFFFNISVTYAKIICQKLHSQSGLVPLTTHFTCPLNTSVVPLLGFLHFSLNGWPSFSLGCSVSLLTQGLFTGCSLWLVLLCLAIMTFFNSNCLGVVSSSMN